MTLPIVVGLPQPLWLVHKVVQQSGLLKILLVVFQVSSGELHQTIYVCVTAYSEMAALLEKEFSLLAT